MVIKIKNKTEKKDSFMFFERGLHVIEMKLIIGTLPFFS